MFLYRLLKIHIKKQRLKKSLKMKNKIPFRKKITFVYFYKKIQSLLSKSRKDANRYPCAYLFLAADYPNLGDVAITYAQEKFIKNVFPNYDVECIPISKTIEGIISLERKICKDDIVFLIGGGNMGDTYDQIEVLRQFVISKFRKNTIFSFPQSIHYSNTKGGNKLLKKSQKVYASCEKLVLFARDKASYELMIKYYSPANNVFLAPDIVLSLDLEKKGKRIGALCCLRSDVESVLDSEEKKYILTTLRKCIGQVSVTDTHISHIIPKSDSKSLDELYKYLFMLFSNFSSAELVITDRLHGLIFCVVTNTPCIFLDNSNKKISSLYLTWLKSNENIFYLDKGQLFKLESIIKELLLEKNYVNKKLSCHFDEIKKVLKYGSSSC